MSIYYVISNIPIGQDACKQSWQSKNTKYTDDPPSFPTPTEPQDQFVRSDAGNLTLLCPVTGSGPPNITWSALPHRIAYICTYNCGYFLEFHNTCFHLNSITTHFSNPGIVEEREIISSDKKMGPILSPISTQVMVHMSVLME